MLELESFFAITESTGGIRQLAIGNWHHDFYVMLCKLSMALFADDPIGFFNSVPAVRAAPKMSENSRFENAAVRHRVIARFTAQQGGGDHRIVVENACPLLVDANGGDQGGAALNAAA